MRTIFTLLLLLAASRVDAAARYAKTAGGNWSAAATWSATGAGGADSAGVPTAADDVILEAASGAVTLDADAACRSLNATSGTGSYAGTLTHAAGVTLSIGTTTAGPGDAAFTLAVGMTLMVGSATTSVLAFVGSSAPVQTITTAGKTLGAVSVTGAGSWRLVDDLTAAGLLTITAGTVDVRGRPLDVAAYVQTGGTIQFQAQTSVVIVRRAGTGAVWTIGASAVMDTPPATITVIQSNAGTRTFAGGGRTYAILNLRGCVCATDQLVITGANTFTALQIAPGATQPALLMLPSGTTTTVGALTVTSTPALLPGIVASTAGQPATLSKASGVVSVDYLHLTDIAATGGATWCAGTHSVDHGGNTGWTFGDCAAARPAGLQMTGAGR